MSQQNSFPTVVLASRNQKKIGEIRELLAPYGIPLISVEEFEGVEDVVEDGDTFQANAEKKASQTALAVGHWAIGEDSGLCVDALKGAPGIYSARYSGPGATDEKNNAKLIDELAGLPSEKRGGKYVCHVAVADPEGNVQLNIEATCRGRIADSARGTNGFGYDPYFEMREYRKTFGELGSVVKQQISHRARAFDRLIPQLLRTLSQAK
ncbi:RdgB/HAM1 family non-canonical purine NTP pyrophosphatase [Thalassoglobus polymorphus]|uniref:dITP/XTP pyrophosphatase n=1 Tax=Thalassoglobus polymorphus TaxID=2527994 RepID=A0A517QHJ3_9PLAN|nr:RdgB/HAM1 family non-canonical purine NTP pyrophosphatase [Thalassoglobus polymorphus]QDT31027.1 Non-canonical purine NTP pyrophosphatase [Thalassoglobus polymorphus]